MKYNLIDKKKMNTSAPSLPFLLLFSLLILKISNVISVSFILYNKTL